MQFIQDEEGDPGATAASAFDNVGFESAGTAIRAVAEDIEIRTEEDGSYTIITPGSSSTSGAGASKPARPEIKYEKPGDDARQAMVERTEARLEKTLSANKSEYYKALATVLFNKEITIIL